MATDNNNTTNAAPAKADVSDILPTNDPKQANEAFAANGIPSVEQQQLALDTVRKLLNDAGVDPRFDEYVTATFSYIAGALYKMSTATDKEAALKEIAEDLKQKWETWVKEREAKEAQKKADEENAAAAGDKLDKPAVTDTTTPAK